MGNKVKVESYKIVITDIQSGNEETYTYGTYDEAVNYYVQYTNAYKGYKIRLYALLKEEIIR